jgi:hypothetical protein
MGRRIVENGLHDERIWKDGSIVMTFLVRECYGSPKKHEF